jgi:molybdopterin converting factor small subunit
MSVEIEISPIFGRYTDDHLNITVAGKTIRECLRDLVRQYPKLEKILLDKDGNLLHSYDIYVNGENLYPKDMTKPVKDGDKLNVVFIIHGG